MSTNEKQMLLRQLELTDRVLGLEAELSQLRLNAAINDLRHVRGSLSWKIGNFILTPILLVKRMLFRIRQGK